MKQKLKRFMAGFMAMLTLVGTLFTNGTTAFAASPQANIAFWNASVKNSGEVSELKPGYNHGKILYSILDGNSAYCMNFGLRADGGQLMNSYDDASTSMSAQQRKLLSYCLYYGFNSTQKAAPSKDDYEQEAMRRGATLCMDKMKGLLLQDKLVEYAYRQLSGEKAPTFHKLLFVYAEDTSAEVLRAAMLQKGFDLILVSSIWEAKRRIFEDKEIELILCDLELPDGTAMELFHTLRRVAGMFQMKNPPVRLLPFFILTENNDPATEYEYRHEGVNDYITAPVNIPELIRRVLFFVE